MTRNLNFLFIVLAIALLAVATYARANGDAPPKPVAAASVGSQKTSSEVQRVLDRLQRHYKETNTFSAKFSQEIATVGAPKRERVGTMSFRKPGRMRWDFTSPEQQTIVSDGETLFSYDADLNQVVKTPLAQALKSSSATSFLLGMGNLSRDFNARLADPAKPDGLIHLALNPKTEAGGGYKIELGLDSESYDLITLTLTDQLGDVTRVKFSAIHKNVRIADSMFAFEVPAGADVVAAPASP